MWYFTCILAAYRAIDRENALQEHVSLCRQVLCSLLVGGQESVLCCHVLWRPVFDSLPANGFEV